MSDETSGASGSVQQVTITEGNDGQRIDNFLLTRLKGVPKSRIYRILRKGEVRVNKGRIRQGYRLKTGDRVRIPPVRFEEREGGAPPAKGALERVERAIIFEDRALLALNKPSGLAVHGGSGLSYGAIEALRVLRPRAPFLELVHRLDRDTSGCLLIAKKRSALRAMHVLLRSGTVAKSYLALVKGAWAGGERRISVPLRKNQLRSGERVVRVDDTGKEAVSLFQPIATCETASLVRVRLVTGRTHQIRVHAQHAGYPLAGDSKYGDELFNRELSELGLKRLFLHASRLEFAHPDSGEKLRIEAPLEEGLVRVLERLGLAHCNFT